MKPWIAVTVLLFAACLMGSAWYARIPAAQADYLSGFAILAAWIAAFLNLLVFLIYIARRR